jgi:hypothetical protein
LTLLDLLERLSCPEKTLSTSKVSQVGKAGLPPLPR